MSCHFVIEDAGATAWYSPAAALNRFVITIWYQNFELLKLEAQGQPEVRRNSDYNDHISLYYNKAPADAGPYHPKASFLKVGRLVFGDPAENQGRAWFGEWPSHSYLSGPSLCAERK